MNPRVIITYVAVSHGTRTAEFLSRFRLTFDAHSPGYPCEVVVCANGGPLSEEDGLWLRQEWKCLPRKNDASWDLGAYFQVAREFDHDIQLCLGESVYFHRAGWLKRIVDEWKKTPYGMYGFYASNLVTQHLNTTAFAIDPRLLRACSIPKSREERHEWEHGSLSFWRAVKGLGRPVKLVTFSGCYDPPEWRLPQRAFWKGDQSDCLAFCNHTQRWEEAVDQTKRRWTLNADVGLSQ